MPGVGGDEENGTLLTIVPGYEGGFGRPSRESKTPSFEGAGFVLGYNFRPKNASCSAHVDPLLTKSIPKNLPTPLPRPRLPIPDRKLQHVGLPKKTWLQVLAPRLQSVLDICEMLSPNAEAPCRRSRWPEDHRLLLVTAIACVDSGLPRDPDFR